MSEIGIAVDKNAISIWNLQIAEHIEKLAISASPHT